jgi:large subunit ribosomal protein L23
MRDLGTLLKLVKFPSLTQKAYKLFNNRHYTFIVDRRLKKSQIKFLFETMFNVTILKVNTCTLPPKTKRVNRFLGNRSNYKKTIVTLKKGDMFPSSLYS